MLDSGEHGGHLLDCPDEAHKRFFCRIPCNRRRVRAPYDLAVKVVCVCLHTEPQYRGVFLYARIKGYGRPCGPAANNRKHACGRGVEGSQVPSLLDPEDLPQPVDDIKRRPARGLVYDEDSVHKPSGWRVFLNLLTRGKGIPERAEEPFLHLVERASYGAAGRIAVAASAEHPGHDGDIDFSL